MSYCAVVKTVDKGEDVHINTLQKNGDPNVRQHCQKALLQNLRELGEYNKLKIIKYINNKDNKIPTCNHSTIFLHIYKALLERNGRQNGQVCHSCGRS